MADEQGGNGKDVTPVGVEVKIEILKNRNGTITVVAPQVTADAVRAILLQAFVNLNEEITVNRAMVLLDAYLTNVQNQQKIVNKVRGH